MEKQKPEPEFGMGVAPEHHGHGDAVFTVSTLMVAGHSPARVPREWEEKTEVNGVLVEPRGDGWVYVYHVSMGRTQRLDDEWFTEFLEFYARTLRDHGFKVQVSGRCVRAKLPEFEPIPKGDPSDWFTVRNRAGEEIGRVEADDSEGAYRAAMRVPKMARVCRDEGGLSTRRLYLHELTGGEA